MPFLALNTIFVAGLTLQTQCKVYWASSSVITLCQETEFCGNTGTRLIHTDDSLTRLSETENSTRFIHRIDKDSKENGKWNKMSAFA